MGPGARLGRPAVREVVRGRTDQRGVQLRRPARRGRQRRPGRAALGGRARGRHPRPHVRRAEGRGLQGRQRADRPRGRGRRPGGDLHADDPRGGRRDAGLRPDRRAAHGGLRRLLRRRARHPDRRLPGEGRHHLRRRLPARVGVGAEARGRRGPGQGDERPRSRRCSSSRRTGQDVEWDDQSTCGGTTPSTSASTEHTPEAFDAEHPLYVMYTSGTTGKPKGILHTTGGYLVGHGVHALGGVRPEARDRRLLVHRRHRLGHRPQLHRLRTARQRRDAGALRGHAGQPGARAAGGRSSRTTRSRSSTPPRRRSARS